MNTNDDKGAAGFFRALATAFGYTIRTHRDDSSLIGSVCAQAFDCFDRNAEIQAEGSPVLACAGECAACCRLRVVATAPEIFLLARFITANQRGFAVRGIDLVDRIISADAAARGLSERKRMELRRNCPFIENGLCLAYRLRPLACRGHASFDKVACEEAAAGKNIDTAVSMPHFVVRSLVQNAVVAASREAGLAWGIYELNCALHIALSIPDAEAKWISGKDPLALAAVTDFDMQEAAAVFDSLIPH